MIVYIIVIGISFISLVVIVRNIVHGLNSRNWPITEGEVVHSGVQAHQSMDDDGDISTTYGASIQYEYNGIRTRNPGDAKILHRNAYKFSSTS